MNCSAVLNWFEVSFHVRQGCYRDWGGSTEGDDCLRAAKKSRATFSTNRMSFPALGAGYLYFLRVLIGSLDCLHLLRLTRVIYLVLLLRHSIKNRSKTKTKAITPDDEKLNADREVIS